MGVKSSKERSLVERIFMPTGDPALSKKSWYEDLFTSPQKEVPLAENIPEKGQRALDQIFAKKQASLNASKPQETPAVTKPQRTTTRPSSVPAQIAPPSIAPPSIAPIAPPQEDKPWYSSLFSGGTPTKPGEYSGLREFGMGTAQFLGNLGNNLTKNYAGNKALNAGFAQKRLEYADRDPASNSSVLTRGMARALGMPIKGDESAFDLKQQMPYVRDMLAARAMQGREGGGDVGQAQPKNNQQAVKDINEHIAAVRDLSAMRKNITSLNRNPLGSLLPDTNADTIATAAEIQKQAQAGVKAIAGPGSIQESEREAFMPLLPNANERSGVALAKQEKAMQTALDKGKKYIKDQLMLGNINEDTARYLMSEYAKHEAEMGRGKK